MGVPIGVCRVHCAPTANISYFINADGNVSDCLLRAEITLQQTLVELRYVVM